MADSVNERSSPLTDLQVEHYARTGFLTTDALTNSSELKAIRQSLLELFSKRAGRDVGDQFDLASPDQDDQEALLSQIMYPAKYAPWLLDTALLQKATAIVTQLLGTQAVCRFEHAILKPARQGVATPWHQDAAYWSPDKIHNTLSIWIAIQEATVENGCLHFIAKSSNREVLPHQSIGNNPKIHGLELTQDALVHITNPIACPLRPGQATVHDGYTLHYAGPNNTDCDRIGLIILGEAPGTRRDGVHDFPWQKTRRAARSQRAAGVAQNHTTTQND